MIAVTVDTVSIWWVYFVRDDGPKYFNINSSLPANKFLKEWGSATKSPLPAGMESVMPLTITKSPKTAKKRVVSKHPLLPEAIHATHRDGKTHAVAIKNLRVLIKQDGDFWVAQGLELDYSAYGKDIEQAKERFENGLRSTLHHNIEAFGTIENVLRVAPDEVWRDFWRSTGSQKKRYSQISIHETALKLAYGVAA